MFVIEVAVPKGGDAVEERVRAGLGEAQVAQGVEGEQLEAIAVVSASRESLFEGRPMVNGAVLAIVDFGLGLDPVLYLVHLGPDLGALSMAGGCEPLRLRRG